MSLLETQTVMARLFTDLDHRARFAANRAATLAQLPLSDDARRQLEGLDPRQVERFAVSLKRRRKRLVRDLAPATVNGLGDHLERLWSRFCDAQRGPSGEVADALGFLDFVLCTRPTEPPWLCDVARFERVRLRLRRAAPPPTAGARQTSSRERRPRLTNRAALASFRYDLEWLYPRLVRGEDVQLAPDPCCLLVGRVAEPPELRSKRINAATALILGLCDGSRTTIEILDTARRRLDVPRSSAAAFDREVTDFLQMLERSGLLELV